MCGISALIHARPDEVGAFGPMTDAIRHRGPDDEGFAFFDRALAHLAHFGGRDTPEAVFRSGFPYAPEHRLAEPPRAAATAIANRRLAILDLSAAGHQPMSYGGRYWITFNGEIYNHVELRRELAAKGHVFASHSDTEVILAAYDQWGDECQHRLRGMWGLVLIDTEARRLLVSRDRFGIKPVYYWTTPSGALAVASEIKQFTRLPGWRAVASRAWCLDYLSNGWIDTSVETAFEGVREVEGGACLRIDLSGGERPRVEVERWYELPRTRVSMSLGDAATELRRLLTESVRIHMRADVKVGSALSGGLDSSAIVCLLRRELGQVEGTAELQESVSSCFDDPRFDERRWIESVVALTGIRSHYVFPRPQALFDLLPRFVWHQDLPVSSLSPFAQWHVFEEARRQGLIVMVDGQGADEQLAGYHVYFTSWFAQLLRSGRLGRLASEVAGWRRLHPGDPTSLLTDSARVMVSLASLRLGRELRPLQTPDWVRGDGGALGYRMPAEAHGSIHERLREQLRRNPLPMYLHYEDRNSTAHSVEARVPFLDHPLVEFILSLPDEHKIHRGETKAVLREAMRGVIPEEVRARQDKMGFVTPEKTWFREFLGEPARAALRRLGEQAPRLVDAALLERRLDEHLAGRAPYDSAFWRASAFGAWLEAFDVAV